MFNIIVNYKQLFTLCFKNEFSGGPEAGKNNGAETEDKTSVSDILSDIKKFQTYVKDGIIEPSEVKELFDSLDTINEESKEGVDLIILNMVKEGFTANSIESYNSYKSLMETRGVKLMSWNEIEKKLLDSPAFGTFGEGFDLKYLKGISLNKDGSTSIKYDKIGWMDTFTIDEDGNTKWSSEDGEHESINKADIDKTLFDSSVVELEAQVGNQVLESAGNLTNENTGKVEKQAINFNKAEFTKDGVYLIQEKLGFTEGDGLDGDFGPNTLKRVQKLSSDGKVGLGVLKQIGLVDKDNNAISGLTKDMFKPGKLEKGNSGKIIFAETNKPVVEPTIEEPTFIDNVEATYEEVSAWLDEAFTGNEDLKSFVGANGENIVIEYNKDKQVLSIDTVLFDGVSDYPLVINKNKITNKETATEYLKGKVKDIKDDYDNKVKLAAVGEKYMDKSSYEQGEIVIDRKASLDIDDIGWDTIIKGVPKGKQEELVKFYKQSGLSLIDFKSMFTEGHSYKDLRAENTFMSKPKVNENERVFADLNGENEYTVTLDRDTNTVNIDGGIMDIGGININKVPTMKELEKVVAWYNTSIRSKIDIPGNTMNYDDIKNDLYEL